MDYIQTKLSLADKLFILTIDDDKGKITPFAAQSLRYGLAGAVLAELSLRGNLLLHDKKLTVVDPNPTGDALLDETLARFRAEKHARKATFWVDALSSRKLVAQVAKGLEDRQVLTIGDKRYHWVGPTLGISQSPVKYQVKQSLRGFILAGERPDTSDVALLSLMKASGLLNLVFTRDEQKAAFKKVAARVEGEDFGKVVAETIRSIESAAAAATLAASG